MNHYTRKKVFRLGVATLGGMSLLFVMLLALSGSPAPVRADPIAPPEGYPKFNSSVKTVTPTLTSVGEQTLTYTIQLVNTGAYTATGVTVVDYLPADVVTYSGGAQSSVSGTFTYDTQVLTWTGDVGFDTTAVLAFTVTLAGEYSGTLENTAVISHPRISDSITRTAETVVTDVPILQIEKSSLPARPGPGNPITYTLTVANWGQPASGLPLTVTDYVPLSTTLRSLGPDAVSGTVGSDTVVTWTRSVTLGLGETTSFVFSVDSDPTTVSGTVITNDPYWVAAGQGVEMAQGAVYTTTLIDPIFRLSKEIWPDPPGSNREMTYTLTLLNVGSLATDIVITDRVPSGITYVRGGNHSTATGVVSWTLPALDTGEFAEVAFSAYISDVIDFPIVNEDYAACCAEGVCQAGKVLTRVVAGPTFVATAELDPFVHQPGGGGSPVTPTLTVRNIGPGNALDAQAILYFDSINVKNLSDIDVIPDGGVLSTGPACGENCVAFVWIGDLAVGDLVTFTTTYDQGDRGRNTRGDHPYSTTVVISDSLSNGSTEPVTATADGFATQYADLVVSKSAPPVIGRGQLMTYSLRVRNNALGTDGNPWLTDVVPLSTTLVGISHDGVSRTLSGTTVISWTLPDLGPAEEVRRTFSVRVDDDLVSGTKILNDNYGVTWVHGTTVFSDTGRTVTTTVQEVGLLHSYKEVTPTLARPGENTILTYYLHIVNSSAFPLRDVLVYDRLPWQYSTYQRDAVVSSDDVVSDIVSVEWLGDVDALSSEVVTFTVLVDPDARGLITNTATISHPDLLEEVVVDAVAYIGEGPLLEISKSAWLDEVEEGDTLTYTIHLRNLGLQATDVVVTDTIPTNATYVPGSASGDGELVNDRLRWEFLVLGAGEDRTVSFAVTVGEGGEVINERYGATCAEEVTASGLPVVTDIAGGTEIYLPLVLKSFP